MEALLPEKVSARIKIKVAGALRLVLVAGTVGHEVADEVDVDALARRALEGVGRARGRDRGRGRRGRGRDLHYAKREGLHFIIRPSSIKYQLSNDR